MRSAVALVAEGAAFLDVADPGWETRTGTNFDVGNENHCVIARSRKTTYSAAREQLCLTNAGAADLGLFVMAPDQTLPLVRDRYRELTVAWKHERQVRLSQKSAEQTLVESTPAFMSAAMMAEVPLAAHWVSI